MTMPKFPPLSDIVQRKEDFGIDGYYIPEFNAALDKPLVYKFSPSKKRKTFIDFAVKQKDFVPPATRYNVAKGLLDPKRGLMTSKGPRKFISEEIAHFAKKNKKPDPGAYEIKTKEKILCALNLKDDRTTFADEAGYLGKLKIAPYDSKFTLVEERARTARYYPLKEEKDTASAKEKAKSPSPVTYNMDESFKSTQLLKPRFFIRKGNYLSLAEETSKKKKFVPPPGAYNHEKAYEVITKGASKGWK
jgi:hypothetical protein